MPQRSKVTQLPRAVKDWLDRALVDASFGGYDALAAELKTRGYAISKSSLHRYGSAFEERLAKLKQATEQARAVVAESPDDEGAMSDALMRLTQQKVFDLLLNVELDADKVDLSKLTLHVARLVRADVPLRKHQIEVRDKLRTKFEQLEGDVASGARSGVTPEALRMIREEVYGILP